MSVVIKEILQNSPAEKAGIVSGMRLLEINGHEINDGLDYEFYSAPLLLSVVLEHDGKNRSLIIKKQEYQALGCCFETYLIDKQHSCKNDCIFCFVRQLPKGLRESLYFKDDDERLGFLFGNYVTLTNLSQKEINRIVEMKISPINISVHTTNAALRVQMMKNKTAGEVLAFIPFLAEHGISINTQLVLCPGLNDGDELRRSIEDLSGYYPRLESIAVVPVGLTKFREGLPQIRPYSAEEAASQLEIMLQYGDSFFEKFGARIVYPSDEWFLKAGVDIPQEDFYDGFPQLENGVGMWRLLEDEFLRSLEYNENYILEKPREIDLVTGVLAGPLIQKLATAAQEVFSGLEIKVHIITNDFLGDGITVAGLLAGQDIIAQIKGKLVSNQVLLPSACLRANDDILLDNVSVGDIATAVTASVSIVQGSGESLLSAFLGEEN